MNSTEVVTLVSVFSVGVAFIINKYYRSVSLHTLSKRKRKVSSDTDWYFPEAKKMRTSNVYLLKTPSLAFYKNIKGKRRKMS